MAKTLVRPTQKGQVTIPKAIRERLRVNTNTFLDVSVEKGKIVFQPVVVSTRVYSRERITSFLKEDKLSKENTRFLKRILKTKKFS